MCIEKNQFDFMLKLKAERTPSLTTLVLFDPVDEEMKAKAATADLKVFSF